MISANNVGSSKITVAVRARPLSGPSDQCAISMSSNSVTLIPYGRGCTVDLPLWSVDRSVAHYVDQQSLFEAIGQPIFSRMVEGYNTTIITYGQSGSGKSHSTFGFADPGLFPRIIGALFEHASLDPAAVYKMDMAMYELFEDGSTEAYMRDVLSEDSRAKLGVREDESGGLQVEGLSWIPVQDHAQLAKAVAEACRSRGGQVQSERTRTAHAFVIVRVARFEPSGIARVNKMTIAVIADSDRAAGSAPGTGPANPSVRALFDSVDSIAHGARPLFTNTLLTWMLKSSLEGDTFTTFLATVSPSVSDADETASTLKLAQCFGILRTHPKISASTLASSLQNSKAAFMHVPAVGTPSKSQSPDFANSNLLHVGRFERPLTPQRLSSTFPPGQSLPVQQRSLSPSRLQGNSSVIQHPSGTSIAHPSLVALQIAPDCFGPSLFEIPQGESRIGSGVSSGSNFAMMITGGGVSPLHASLFSDGRGHVQIKKEGRSFIQINGQTCSEMADLVDGCVVTFGNAAMYTFHVNESNVVQHSVIGGMGLPTINSTQNSIDTSNPAVLEEWYRTQEANPTKRGGITSRGSGDTLRVSQSQFGFGLTQFPVAEKYYPHSDGQPLLFELPRPASPPQGVVITAANTIHNGSTLTGFGGIGGGAAGAFTTNQSLNRRPPLPTSTAQHIGGAFYGNIRNNPAASTAINGHSGMMNSSNMSGQRPRQDIVHGVSMASPEFMSRSRGADASFRGLTNPSMLPARNTNATGPTKVNSSTNTSDLAPAPSMWSQVHAGLNGSAVPRPEISATTSSQPPHAAVNFYPDSQQQQRPQLKQPHIAELNDGRSIKLSVPVMNGVQWVEVVLDTEEMLMTMRAQIDQKDHMLGQDLYPKSFRGGLAVDWILAWIRRCHDSQHGRSSDPQWEATFRKPAEMVFEVMCQRGQLQQKTGDMSRPSAHPSYLFSLKGALVASPRESVATNASTRPQAPPDYKTLSTDETSLRSISVGENLLRFILRALVLAGDRPCKDTAEFEQFLDLVSEILTLDVSKFSAAQKMAFWLNVYNCLFLHGHIVSALADGTDMKEFLAALMFDVEYRIGGVNYCLDTIFNQILRAPGPAGRCHDPRVHFACVNGTMSSPPIALYTPENIDEELDIAAERYLQNMVDVRPPNSIILPRCFKWCAKDFGQTKAQVLRFVAQYLQEPHKQQVLEMAKSPAGVNMQYAEYDWRLWMKQGPQGQGLGPYSTARDCVDM